MNSDDKSMPERIWVNIYSEERGFPPENKMRRFSTAHDKKLSDNTVEYVRADLNQVELTDPSLTQDNDQRILAAYSYMATDKGDDLKRLYEMARLYAGLKEPARITDQCSSEAGGNIRELFEAWAAIGITAQGYYILRSTQETDWKAFQAGYDAREQVASLLDDAERRKALHTLWNMLTNIKSLSEDKGFVKCKAIEARALVDQLLSTLSANPIADNPKK